MVKPQSTPPFTAEQDGQIRAEYEGGVSVSRLAAKWKSTVRLVTAAVKRAGGKMRWANRGQHWWTDENGSYWAVFSTEQEREIVASYRGGDSIPIIARR